MKIEPAVQAETKKIALGTAILTVLMIAVFLVLRQFDWRVLTGAALGYLATVGNFFAMAMTCIFSSFTAAICLGFENHVSKST